MDSLTTIFLFGGRSNASVINRERKQTAAFATLPFGIRERFAVVVGDRTFAMLPFPASQPAETGVAASARDRMLQSKP